MQVDICMVVHNDVEHDSRVLKEAGSLAAHGWNVLIMGVALSGSELPDTESKNGFTIVRVKPPFFRRAAKTKFAQAMAVALTLPALALRLRQIKAPYFHAHDFPGLLQLALAGITGQSVVYDSHELFFDRPLGIPFFLSQIVYALRPLEKRLARHTQASITVNDSIADRLSQTLNIPRPIVVRNAVDIRIPDAPAVVYPTQGKRSVVHTGNIVKGRHLRELVGALAHLPEDVVVVFMGKGPLEAELRAYAETLGASDRLLFVPRVPPEAVASTLAQGDIAAVLTTTVGMNNNLSLPNKFFEAIAASTPMITGPDVEIARLVRQYDIGMICNPHESLSIAEAIRALLEPENYARCRASMDKARSELNWEHEEQKLIALYQRAMETR